MDDKTAQSASGSSSGFEYNFSRLALSKNSAFDQHCRPTLTRSNSIPTNLQHSHQIIQPIVVVSQEHISDRISKIIQQNQSIVGKLTQENKDTLGRRASEKVDTYRKRAIRGPWRYEERILQLGYQPQPSANPSRRRNSLPVQTLTPREIIRPYHSTAKSAFKRRTSLPVVPSCGDIMCDSSNGRLSTTLSSSANDINNQGRPIIQMRPSVIQANPAHRGNQGFIEEEPTEQSKAAAQSESAESDSSELIIVDDAEKSVLHSVPFVPKVNDASMTDDTTSDNSESPNASSPGTSVIRCLPVRPIPDRNHSSVIKPIPSQPMVRKITMEPLLEHNSKKMKAENIIPIQPTQVSSNVPANVLFAIEEVQRKAAATVTQPTGNPIQPITNINTTLQPNRSSTIGSTITRVGDGDIPNAVLHNPLMPSGSRNGYKALEQGVDINSDEEDTRPYKCYECQKGFRISGHLARHMKSELHLKRIQELRELGLDGQLTHITQSRAIPLEQPIISSTEHSSSSPPPPPLNQRNDDQGLPIGSDPDSISRRFRCNICNTAFRFQGHLDRHMRSTTHHSMVEAVESDFHQIPSTFSSSN